MTYLARIILKVLASLDDEEDAKIDSLETLQTAEVDRRLRSPDFFWNPRHSVSLDSFSLHAGVRVHGHDRQGLERLSPYAVRPPLALHRLGRPACLPGALFTHLLAGAPTTSDDARSPGERIPEAMGWLEPRGAILSAEQVALTRAVGDVLASVWPSLQPEHRAALVAELERGLASAPRDATTRPALAALAKDLRGRAEKEGLILPPAPPASAPRQRLGMGWRRCALPEEEGAAVEVSGMISGMSGPTTGTDGRTLRLSLVAAEGAYAVRFRAMRIAGGPTPPGGLEERAEELKRTFERPGTTVTMRAVRAGALPAYELATSGGARAGAVRVFEADGGVYTAIAEYDPRLEPLVRGSVRRFLDSFVLTADAPPAP